LEEQVLSARLKSLEDVRDFLRFVVFWDFMDFEWGWEGSAAASMWKYEIHRNAQPQ